MSLETPPYRRLPHEQVAPGAGSLVRTFRRLEVSPFKVEICRLSSLTSEGSDDKRGLAGAGDTAVVQKDFSSLTRERRRGGGGEGG